MHKDNIYSVYINGQFKHTVFNKEDAWKSIKEEAFGSLFVVYNGLGIVREEFVCF